MPFRCGFVGKVERLVELVGNDKRIVCARCDNLVVVVSNRLDLEGGRGARRRKMRLREERERREREKGRLSEER